MDARTFVRDTLLIFSRSMRLSMRNPIWVLLNLTQPVLYLALFGPLLEQLPLAGDGQQVDNTWRIFVPGLLVQLGIFGASFVGFGLIAEYRAGVVERMRVTPASRMALLLGRVMRDIIVLTVQATLLVLVAIPFGLRAPWPGVVAGILVVGLLAAAFSSFSYAAALRLKSEDSLAPLLNGLALPVLLLSGILLPMTLAPRWLELLSDVNPLKHTVDGVRAFFAVDGSMTTALWGIAATVFVVIVGLVFGARTFRRETG